MAVVGVSGGFCFYIYPDTDPESRRSTHCTHHWHGDVGGGPWLISRARQARLTVAVPAGPAVPTKAAPRLCTSHCRAHLAKAHGPRRAHLTSRTATASACMHARSLARARHGLTGTTDQSSSPIVSSPAPINAAAAERQWRAGRRSMHACVRVRCACACNSARALPAWSPMRNSLWPAASVWPRVAGLQCSRCSWQHHSITMLSLGVCFICLILGLV
jgi:hypothetical protein